MLDAIIGSYTKVYFNKILREKYTFVCIKSVYKKNFSNFAPKIGKIMAANIGDFFIYSNSVQGVTEEDYRKIELLVNTVESFARSTYQCVYIIDYFKKDFLYVSENMAYLCGQSSEKIKDFGYRLYIDYVPEKDQQMLLEINKKGFELYESIPVDERMDYSITYDFHIMNGKKQRLVNHTLTPIFLTNDGRVWLALCTFSLSARKTPGHIIMKKSGENKYYEYSLEKHRWEYKDAVPLNSTERDVLILSAQGYTMNEIAERLFKSVDTIKACKRTLFAKLEVNNIAEALSLATNYRML